MIPDKQRAPSIVITLHDGTILSLSKSESSTIHVATAEGLVIDFLADGKVNQRLVPAVIPLKGVQVSEISRTIFPDVT